MLAVSEGRIIGLQTCECDDGKVIQASAPFDRGASGGGLFDQQDRLVGTQEPNNPEAWMAMGRASLGQWKTDQAIHAFQRVLMLDSTHSEAKWALQQLEIELGQSLSEPGVQAPVPAVRQTCLDRTNRPRTNLDMRSLRVLLAFLIALALPAQALGDVLSRIACCPMAEVAASVDTAAAAHDCRQDEDGHGKRCASGPSCKCGSHVAISTRVFVPHLPDVFLAHVTPPMQPQSVLPVALWRPPTLPSPLC